MSNSPSTHRVRVAVAALYVAQLGVLLEGKGFHESKDHLVDKQFHQPVVDAYG